MEDSGYDNEFGSLTKSQPDVKTFIGKIGNGIGTI